MQCGIGTESLRKCVEKLQVHPLNNEILLLRNARLARTFFFGLAVDNKEIKGD
jgi:hypothetical protein